MEEPMRRVYRGSRIEVTFDLARCIHVAECIRGLPQVFDLDRQPWAHPDEAHPDAVAAVIERCPSGALLYRRLDGGPDETHEGTTVVPIRDGPLRVVGGARIVLEDGSEEILPRATLCRCGASRNEPFCDNAHLDIGFTAPGEFYRFFESRVRPSVEHPITARDDPRREA
jgi:uncharacterized Fe-S cluster protein YjdI/CDGSH-type Zn-finger protein